MDPYPLAIMDSAEVRPNLNRVCFPVLRVCLEAADAFQPHLVSIAAFMIVGVVAHPGILARAETAGREIARLHAVQGSGRRVEKKRTEFVVRPTGTAVGRTFFVR